MLQRDLNPVVQCTSNLVPFGTTCVSPQSCSQLSHAPACRAPFCRALRDPLHILQFRAGLRKGEKMKVSRVSFVFRNNICSLSLLKMKPSRRNQPAVLVIHKYDFFPLGLHSFAVTWSAPRTISLSVSSRTLGLSLTVLTVIILILFVLKSKLKNKVQSQKLPEDFVNVSTAATMSDELNQS